MPSEEPAEDTEMQPRYSFKGGQRGRYAHLFPQGPHVAQDEQGVKRNMGKVCQTTYQVPEDLEAIVWVLNEAHSGSLSLEQEAETFWIYTGDQLMFKADTKPEAIAFLQGILVAVTNWN